MYEFDKPFNYNLNNFKYVYNFICSFNSLDNLTDSGDIQNFNTFQCTSE